MFPLKDENPTEITPYVTVAIIVANVAVWIGLQNGGVGVKFLESLCVYGAIPGEITGAIPAGDLVPLGPGQCRVGGLGAGSLVSSMFMHGGWMHLIGNMWFLWVFGNNIEDSMGHLRFVVFYLLTGLIASGAHILTSARQRYSDGRSFGRDQRDHGRLHRALPEGARADADHLLLFRPHPVPARRVVARPLVRAAAAVERSGPGRGDRLLCAHTAASRRVWR